MIARNYSTKSYRLGFNTQEKDDEVKGNGNHLSFGDYGYDTRLGKRWNREPLINKFPYFSDYLVFANSPINLKDEDGNSITTVNKEAIQLIYATIEYFGGNAFIEATGEKFDAISKGDGGQFFSLISKDSDMKPLSEKKFTESLPKT